MSEKPVATDGPPQRFTVVCLRCDRPLLARVSWVGRDVRCPYCSSILRVPPPQGGQPVRAQRPTLTPMLQFNFGCPRCQTLLEAHTGLCGQAARCPACGARLVVPPIRPGTRKPQEAQLLDDADQLSTPIHAYAASGDQAPRIVTRPDGTHAIQCPRCYQLAEVDADSCPSCGAPFTSEAAVTVAAVRSSSRATAALVLGLLSLPLCVTVIPGLLAVTFGVLGMGLGTGRRPPGAAVAGLVLGLVSLALAGYIYYRL